MTIEELRKSGWIAYEYRRGSHMYHLNVETSDEDTGGVFICPPDMLTGLRSNYIEQVADEKNDTVFYELGRWVELLLKSNPTALESLFAPKDCIVGDVHPVVQNIIDNRDMFLSKECFKTFYGYAVSQIGKARGLNKKIVNPVVERKGVLDFCYVPYGQGTKKVKDWLRDHGLFQQYCGLVDLPNMHDNYGLYYDWGTHIICEYGVDFSNKVSLHNAWDKICNEMDNWEDENTQCFGDTLTEQVFQDPYRTYFEQFCDIVPYGFTGIVNRNEDSNEVRICTVPKGNKPLITMSYNKNGYESHCRDYKEYKEWEAKRNPVRYESNLNKNYDSKNVMHCMRLTRMAKELAQGNGFNVVRDADREYLLNIRNHMYEYEEVMAQLEIEKKEMEDAIKTSTLPVAVDYDKVNQLLTESRNIVYKNLK